MMAEYLLASAACFPAFETRRIENSKYIDGGYRNNLPIDRLEAELGANGNHRSGAEIHRLYPQAPGRRRAGARYIRSYWNLGIFPNFDSPASQATCAWGTLTPCALIWQNRRGGLRFSPGFRPG